MGRAAAAFKGIPAALLLGVGFSAPLRAQDVASPPPAEELAELAPDASAREADLLAQLREAETPEAAALVESALGALRSRSGSAAIDLLLRRGQDALEAGDAEAAIEHFSAAIDHAPGFAEAYAGRAAAFYLTGRAGPALDDLREALVLNPRHHQAMMGFAVLLEELGRPADALEVWRRVADMNPQSPEAQAAVARLAVLVEGRTL